MLKKMKDFLHKEWKTSIVFRAMIVCLGFWSLYHIFFFPIFAIIDLLRPIFFLYFIFGGVMVGLSYLIDIIFWLGMCFGISYVIDLIKEQFKN